MWSSLHDLAFVCGPTVWGPSTHTLREAHEDIERWAWHLTSPAEVIPFLRFEGDYVRQTALGVTRVVDAVVVEAVIKEAPHLTFGLLAHHGLTTDAQKILHAHEDSRPTRQARDSLPAARLDVGGHAIGE